MLEQYFIKPATIDRIRACWLGPQIESYVEWMHDNGYATCNVFRRVPVLCQFADFAATHGATDPASAAQYVEAFTSCWVATHGSKEATEAARHGIVVNARGPVQQMLSLAIAGSIKRERWCKPFPFEQEARGFAEYLRQERGLRESTLYQYAHALNRFDGYLRQMGVQYLSELSPPLLASFMIHAAPYLGRTSRRNLCGMLRVFLRYCRREGIVHEDLESALGSPQTYRLADVPRSITWDEVRRMLAVVDRRTILGRRDYAILLLLVTYGLRGHEVASLTLDDIDWKRERLQVPERKAGHWTAYPLASVVAEALIDYLKHGRPSTTDRHLFFRVLAPRKAIASAAISLTVAKYLHRAGIKVHRAGAHTLRHTCVQRLIDAEFPLKTIGDYVGHRSASSTEVYSKVALAALREVAMGDGEAL